MIYGNFGAHKWSHILCWHPLNHYSIFGTLNHVGTDEEIDRNRIDADIEPLGLRREASVIEMVEIYTRSDPTHPNRKTVEEWIEDNRIKQNSILKIGKKFKLNLNLTKIL